MKKPNIILAADHAGFELKQAIKEFLSGKGYEVDDVGANEYVEDDDYPRFMALAATKVSQSHGGSKAIVFGKSGQGEAMVSNRFFGVRAVVWYGGSSEASEKIITLSREHNDANVLSVAADFVDSDQTKKAVELWLSTGFSGDERHMRRIGEIDKYPKSPSL